MVSNPVENDYQKSNSLTKSSKGFSQSRREDSPSNSKLVTETGGMASIRQSLSSKVISERELSTESQMPEEQVLSQITNWPGESELAGAIGSKLIPLVTI